MPTRVYDELFMRAALEEARRGSGQTSPNPAVGAVLVVGKTIVARGYHRRAGEPHAEAECLAQFGGRVPKSAVLYVTLEPCSTAGRTPACTDTLRTSGVRNLVIGTLDPNPVHAGRGIELLRDAGLTVRTGVLAQECAALNRGFNKWIQTGLPFVIAKCGMSLDGRLTAPPSESQWLTSPAARRHARKLRSSVDAILVGAQTVRADNPRLTTRGRAAGKQPWRIVLSRSGKLRRDSRVFTDRFAARTKVFGEIKLPVLLRELGKQEITSVLIEGGGEILGQALDARIIDQVQIYIAPILCGGPTVAFGAMGVATTAAAARLTATRYEAIGSNLCVTAALTYAA
ncbi:MAG TPA: bifunctional diaminohydroxyphosphoribosylaminopyrimidine deaminase/5-amino-6-(5-phosphoribosylamino)uracil reductase RibD [Chthoniobacterales bacterium]|jgi:diaminohydroxyphosphoribosylaminopyrimidine deaminase/5-amino-6-(5-phosphoribosylamino)uracil reductase|nr:bifunctional diaminohydroxyphosphoribosylaminopyrimidine deaminase/5-amino-6-(5-phosphoribosylamino)uracil reductase RibD [Chthoniobacterales bacterium]